MFQCLAAHVGLFGEDGHDVGMEIVFGFFHPGGLKLVAEGLVVHQHLFLRRVIDEFHNLVKTVDKFLKLFGSLVGHQRIGFQIFEAVFKSFFSGSRN